jgi:2'-hydroxyisoflavone reductase
VSSISAYRQPLPTNPLMGATEEFPLATLTTNESRLLSNNTYGALKAECEQEVRHVFGAQAVVLRPGMIIGKHDPTDRFHRIVRMIHGRHPLPLNTVTPPQPVQWIDAVDVATFIIRCVMANVGGTFNVCGPSKPVPWNAWLESIAEVCQRTVVVSQAELHESEVPFWLTNPEDYGLFSVSNVAAIETGLSFTSLEQTVRQVLTELCLQV